MEYEDKGVNPLSHKVATTAIVGAWLLFVVLEASVVFAAEPAKRPDRLDTPACQNAQRDLENTLASADGKSQDEQFKLKLQVEKSRGIVASRCFDRAPETSTEAAEKSSRRPAVQTPVAVEPIAVNPAISNSTSNGPTGNPATALAPPALAPAPVQIARPTTLGTCDAGGCWDSNGTRLNGLTGGASPVLIGPQGPCVAQGGFSNCK